MTSRSQAPARLRGPSRRGGTARLDLHPPASLGVIGSGQLGRMFIQAAQRMGYRAGVLSTSRRARPPPRLPTGRSSARPTICPPSATWPTGPRP